MQKQGLTYFFHRKKKSFLSIGYKIHVLLLHDNYMYNIDMPVPTISALLDDLDKELNNYVMRAREWYGWHFPEMGKIIADNLAYARTVMFMGRFSI